LDVQHGLQQQRQEQQEGPSAAPRVPAASLPILVSPGELQEQLEQLHAAAVAAAAYYEKHEQQREQARHRLRAVFQDWSTRHDMFCKGQEAREEDLKEAPTEADRSLVHS
jgi:hypothetical protein